MLHVVAAMLDVSDEYRFAVHRVDMRLWRQHLQHSVGLLFDSF
jgi:hypothetical protein